LPTFGYTFSSAVSPVAAAPAKPLALAETLFPPSYVWFKLAVDQVLLLRILNLTLQAFT